MQSLKKECIRYGIPLLVRYRFLRDDEIAFSTHTLSLDSQYFDVTVDGKTKRTVMGVGFDEEEAFADFVIGLRLLLMGHGETPIHDVRIVGRSVYDQTVQEVVITPKLTV